MTGIAWTSTTWNPTTGCDRVSPGCDVCYALTMAKRLKAMGVAEYQRDGDPKTSGPGFGVTTHEHRLDQPLRWRKPRRVFVDSMADLWHEEVPDEFIARVWATMMLSPKHTFQILTKRHGRMRSLLQSEHFPRLVRDARDRTLELSTSDGPAAFELLPNVHLGVSAESQKWAVTRVKALSEVPAAVRFVSAEPLLAPIDLTTIPGAESIGWLIVGGESGAGARWTDQAWIQALVDQCDDLGIACFVKQLGAPLARSLGLRGKGDDPERWPVAWPQEFPAPPRRRIRNVSVEGGLL